MMTSLSPESKERLKGMLCMRVDGATMREIADKYGCSHQYVQMRFSKLLAAQKDPHCIYSAIAEWMSMQSTISMWESGEAMPRTDKLIKLAQILEVTVDELLKAE